MKKIEVLFGYLILMFIPGILFSAPINGNNNNMNANRAVQFQNKLDDAIHNYNLIGLQVSVRTSDEFKWNGAGGLSNLKSKATLTPDDVLRIGSITKTFIAVSILKLAEEKRIDLDESISYYFPEFESFRSITVRMLLNQTSGIENYWKSGSALMKTLLGKKWDSDDLLKLIAKQKPHAQPEETFYYSNSNYVLLAALVEKITQTKINEILNDFIYSKCSISNTYFLPQNVVPKKLITGYDKVYIPWIGYYKLKPKNKTWPKFAYGAGAMASNTSDLISFIDSLFYGSLLNHKTVDEMQVYNPKLQSINDAIPGQVSYGLGIARFEIGTDVLWGHMGGLMGFESIVLHCKEKNYSIAIIGNLSICNVVKIVEEYQQLLQ